MRSFIFITAALTPPNCNIGFGRCVASSSKRSITFGRPFITLLSATIQEKKQDKDDDNDDIDSGADDDFDVDSVSDAEALLACRSYLQRRNRLGQWTQFEKRKVKRSNKQSLSSASAMSSSNHYGDKGFFWDDPSELKYLYKNKDNLPAFSNSNSASEPLVIMTGKDGVEDNEDDDDNLTLLQEDEELLDDDYDGDSDEDDMWESIRPQVSEHRSFSSTEQKRSQRQTPTLLFWEDEDDDVLGETSQDFAVFDGTPSPEHVRRSRAAKRTWSDPEWRAQWHEKRWGTSRHSSMQNRNELRRRRKLEQRLRALDPDKFLPNQALAAMSENEIAHAIQEYVSSNRRRGRTRAKTKQTQRQEATFTSNKTATTFAISIKDMTTTTAAVSKTPITTTTNSSSTCKLTRHLEPDVMDLAKVQKRRSERAMKAYQTRLQNQRVKVGAEAKNDDVRKLVKTRLMKSHNNAVLSPSDALLQVERDLNEGFLPNIQHVQALIEPKRLGCRKDVLLRILSDCFGLRGKCIPATLPCTASTLTGNDDYPAEEATSVGDDHDETRFLFATTAPVQQLGEFIVWKLQTARVHVTENT